MVPCTSPHRGPEQPPPLLPSLPVVPLSTVHQCRGPAVPATSISVLAWTWSFSCKTAVYDTRRIRSTRCPAGRWPGPLYVLLPCWVRALPLQSLRVAPGRQACRSLTLSGRLRWRHHHRCMMVEWSQIHSRQHSPFSACPQHLPQQFLCWPSFLHPWSATPPRWWLSPSCRWHWPGTSWTWWSRPPDFIALPRPQIDYVVHEHHLVQSLTA